jgi:hypothetical protein
MYSLARTDHGVQMIEQENVCLEPGDIRCRVIMAGVCGTDLQVLRGSRNVDACILGHEGISIIEEVNGADKYALLDRVITINPTPAGRSAEVRHTIDGMWQEQFRLPAHLNETIVTVPNSFPLEFAGLIKPLGSVLEFFRIVNHCHSPRTVLCIGRGTIGRLVGLFSYEMIPSARECTVVGSEELRFVKGPYDLVVLCSDLESYSRSSEVASEVVASDGILYLFGGCPLHGRIGASGIVDIQAVRARNSGGLSSEAMYDLLLFPAARKSVKVAGHRGCSNGEMSISMGILMLDEYYTRMNKLVRTASFDGSVVSLLNKSIANRKERNWTKLTLDFCQSERRGVCLNVC